MNLVIAEGQVVPLALVRTIVLAPLAFYPFSKALRVAIELIMRPVDAPEPADAL